MTRSIAAPWASRMSRAASRGKRTPTWASTVRIASRRWSSWAADRTSQRRDGMMEAILDVMRATLSLAAACTRTGRGRGGWSWPGRLVVAGAAGRGRGGWSWPGRLVVAGAAGRGRGDRVSRNDKGRGGAGPHAAPPRRARKRGRPWRSHPLLLHLLGGLVAHAERRAAGDALHVVAFFGQDVAQERLRALVLGVEEEVLG